MRPSGGVLYLFLALALVRAAPGHPLARRSIVVDYNIKDVADAANPDSNIKDMMNNVLQEALDSPGVLPMFVHTTTVGHALRADVTGNDDTGDVTSPGPGDADPERASADSVTLS
ncbi:uncharacterized protein LOC118407657 [Branchiostoma floridae]|uniref:Uncharacterized protein LOC118407657 n=1 Tax=Branchiostoma floridae TaxID=7739 RepID=A0A9J7HTF7_BRAFL|nr:uncharacterized protein LOC118407657 [Branchiostoma floridae]